MLNFNNIGYQIGEDNILNMRLKTLKKKCNNETKIFAS